MSPRLFTFNGDEQEERDVDVRRPYPAYLAGKIALSIAADTFEGMTNHLLGSTRSVKWDADAGVFVASMRVKGVEAGGDVLGALSRAENMAIDGYDENHHEVEGDTCMRLDRCCTVLNGVRID